MREVGLSLSLLILKLILIDRYTASVSSTEQKFLLEKSRLTKAAITADVSAKGGPAPAFYAVEPNSFLFSVLSGILLHKHSQKGSKVKSTIIKYFICDAKFDLREGCYVCIENNDDQNEQNLSP